MSFDKKRILNLHINTKRIITNMLWQFITSKQKKIIKNNFNMPNYSNLHEITQLFSLHFIKTIKYKKFLTNINKILYINRYFVSKINKFGVKNE